LRGSDIILFAAWRSGNGRGGYHIRQCLRIGKGQQAAGPQRRNRRGNLQIRRWRAPPRWRYVDRG